MKSISIKDLHEKTGHWLRQVKAEGELIVTERGSPVARLLPPAQQPTASPFVQRKLLHGVARLMQRAIGGPGSADVISEMREGR